jgi:hypothetical protein
MGRLEIPHHAQRCCSLFRITCMSATVRGVGKEAESRVSTRAADDVAENFGCCMISWCRRVDLARPYE